MNDNNTEFHFGFFVGFISSLIIFICWYIFIGSNNTQKPATKLDSSVIVDKNFIVVKDRSNKNVYIKIDNISCIEERQSGSLITHSAHRTTGYIHTPAKAQKIIDIINSQEENNHAISKH